MTLIDDVRHYRQQESLVGKSGVVVFFQGAVQGALVQIAGGAEIS